MSFDYDTEEYTEEAGDVSVGWDSNVGKWLLAVADGDGGYACTNHDTYRSAMADILNNYPYAACYHERNGGGIVGGFAAWEEFLSGWSDEQDDKMENYEVPESLHRLMN